MMDARLGVTQVVGVPIAPASLRRAYEEWIKAELAATFKVHESGTLRAYIYVGEVAFRPIQFAIRAASAEAAALSLVKSIVWTSSDLWRDGGFMLYRDYPDISEQHDYGMTSFLATCRVYFMPPIDDSVLFGTEKVTV